MVECRGASCCVSQLRPRQFPTFSVTKSKIPDSGFLPSVLPLTRLVLVEMWYIFYATIKPSISAGRCVCFVCRENDIGHGVVLNLLSTCNGVAYVFDTCHVCEREAK